MKAAEATKLMCENITLKSRVELLESRIDDALYERDKARLALEEERRFWRTELDKTMDAIGSRKEPTNLDELADTAEDKEKAKHAEAFSKKWDADHAFWHETSGFSITEGKNG